MTMQETMINQELANLDLSKVAAFHQKRTLALINHFVVTTTGFLNNFTKKCEGKLMRFERKLEKVEATMVLLEARLSSIPAEVDTPSSTTATVETKDPIAKSTEQIDNEGMNIDKEQSQNTEIKENEPVNPEYERFVKMVQVGVPLEAVKLKASLEGLDAKILEKILGK